MDVLVVDDEPDIRLTLGEFLRDEGYSVGELEDGSALVDVLEHDVPRLLLLDLTMPGFDPAKTLGALHERGLLEHTSVLALSGVEDAESVARELGLDGAVRKPFDIDALLAIVARYCRPSARSHDTSHAHL